MPVKTRGRAAKSSRPKRQPTQFGELDTTPTSRHLQSPSAQKPPSPDEPAEDAGPTSPGADASTNKGRPEPQPDEIDEDLDEDLDDDDLIQFDCPEQTKSQSTQSQDMNWSEAVSTRRSSPLREGETPKGIWEFGEERDSPDQLFSPGSEEDKLPDTVPLPPGPSDAPLSQSLPEVERRVDFSETASTMRRSSPFHVGSTPRNMWEFGEASSQGALPHLLPNFQTPCPCPPASPPAHYPIDEMYDATPPRPGSQNRVLQPGQDTTALEDQQKKIGDPTPPETLPRKDLKPSSVLNAPKPPRRSMDQITGEPASNNEQISPCLEHGNMRTASPGIRSQPLSHQVHESVTQPLPQTCPTESSILMAPKPSRRSIDKLVLDTDFGDEQPEPSPCLDQESMRRGSTALRKAPTRSQAHQPVMQPAPQAGAALPPTAQGNTKGKKKKQRAKTPIQFDEATNEIKEVPRPRMTGPPSKQPILNALKKGVQKLSSPVPKARKRAAPKAAPKRKPPKKQPSQPSRATNKQRSPSNVIDPVTNDIEVDEPAPTEPTKEQVGEADITEEHVHPGGSPTFTTINVSTAPISEPSEDPEISDDANITSEGLCVRNGVMFPGPPPPPRKQEIEDSDEVASGFKATQKHSPDKIQSDGRQKKVLTSSLDGDSPDSTNQEMNSVQRVAEANSAEIAKRVTRSRKNDPTSDTRGSKVLAPRDPNRSMNRPLRPPKNAVVQKKRPLDQAGSASSQPSQKARKLSRSYSIGETGSPLPLEATPWGENRPEYLED